MRWFALAMVVAALLMTGGVAAAQTVADQKVWVSGEGTADVTPDLRLGVEQQLRLNDSASGFEQTFTELGARYRIAPRFRVGGFYRVIVLDDETRHRFGGDGEARQPVGRAELGFRLRLQHTLRDAGGRTVLRPRLKIAFDAPHRLTPFVAGELFFELGDNQLDEQRLAAGLDWDATKRVGLTAFYLFQHEDKKMDEQAHVLGLGVVWKVRVIPRRKPRGADIK